MDEQEEWDVLLPIIGLELSRSEVTFGPFAIKKLSASSMNDEHNLRIKDSMWSPTALSVKITGKAVSTDSLCDWCPSRGELYTRPLDINGEVKQVTALPRKTCICLAFGSGSDRIDAVGLAIPLLEDLLSLIRLYIYISSRGSYPAFNIISLQRLPHYSAVAALNKNGLAYSEEVIPGTRKYDVPLEQREVDVWIRHLGFEEFASIIYRSHMGDHLTDIQEVLGASLIQFGSMLEEANLRDCFLRGATAVEAIANAAPGTGGISLRFREIGATLATLATHPELISQSTPQVDSEVQTNWKADRTRLKSIYEHRCHISHGSRRLNETDEELLYSSQAFLAKIALGALLLFVDYPHSKQQFYAKLVAVQKSLST